MWRKHRIALVAAAFPIALPASPQSAAREPTAAPASLPSLFTAVQEQPGLKLESQKTAVEMLVILRRETAPAEN